METLALLKTRESQIAEKGDTALVIDCEKKSVSGSVSQRACVFCGSRVVLYPIADALHIVHGPVGCAAYTTDIRGSLSSGPSLNRAGISTDLREKEVIFGGEKKLRATLIDLIDKIHPKAAFVYSTCIVGIIGDDIDAVCLKVSQEKGIPVIPVHSEGFKGTKKDGYAAACEALSTLIGTGDVSGIKKIKKESINILGEFNLAGEAWIIKKYYESIGVQVVSVITGDGRVDDIRRAHGASLNVVQCSGSMTHLAKIMKERYGIPFIRVSYFGIEDMAAALYDTASFFKKADLMEKARDLVKKELTQLLPQLIAYRQELEGKKAGIYVGGAFKAFSLIKALRHLGISVVLAGSQTGTKEDYKMLGDMCDKGTVIVDDSNPAELSKFLIEKGADMLIGGVKERPIAYKLGLGFCDHNHERKIPLAGFEGMLNFAKEVHMTLTSPVWKFTRNRDE